MQKYLLFSEEEYRERANKLRNLMAKKGLAGVILTKGANLIYFTGYRTTLYASEFRPFIAVIPTEGEPTLIVPNLEEGGARKTSWIDDVRIWGGTKGCQAPDGISLLAQVLREKKLDDKKMGIEASTGQRLWMTLEQFQQLKAACPKLEFGDSADCVWPVRMIKSPREIEYMRRACWITDRAFDAAVSAIRPGATEREVHVEMTRTMMAHGADLGGFITVTAGLNRYDMMNPIAVEGVVMKEGDMVVMDFGAMYNGYTADITRGVFVGEPNPRAADLYRKVEEMNQAALAACKPGNPIKEIDLAATRKITELGLRDLMLHRTGHALGVEIHELPSIGPDEETILQPGMIFAIEPAVYDFTVGGFRIENNIVITETGYEYLTHSTNDIVVKK